MVRHLPPTPRQRSWRPLAAAALTTAAMTALLLAPPGSTQQAPQVSGGGTVVIKTPNTHETPEGKEIAEPPFLGNGDQAYADADFCSYFTNAEGKSIEGYSGSYSVTDKAGTVHTYGPGPVTVTIGWTDTYEGPNGTYAPPTPIKDKVQCDDSTAGYKYPITHASLTGAFQGKSVTCAYEAGAAARSRYSRDRNGLLFELYGTCSLVDAGVNYGLTTVETRAGRVSAARFDGSSRGAVEVTVVETYSATTACTSATCTPKPKPDPDPDPEPDPVPEPDPEPDATTTTTSTTPGATTTTSHPPALGPSGASPPRRGTLLAAPVQAPTTPGTPTGGLPSGLAGPATGGGGLAQAPPAPVAGSAPSAATATAAGGAPAGSSAFVPTAAAAPGTAGAAARVAAPLPLIAAVPGADAAAQYNMVRHERPAIPAPVLAVGGGLWLMFVCAAGVRILNPRPEPEPEPVPAPAVGFPVDIEEESP